MSQEVDLATVRHQVSVLADQVVTLVEIISRQTDNGIDTAAARNKMDILEHLMWRLHARQARLKNLLN
jgi:hypothetical protein